MNESLKPYVLMVALGVLLVLMVWGIVLSLQIWFEGVKRCQQLKRELDLAVEAFSQHESESDTAAVNETLREASEESLRQLHVAFKEILIELGHAFSQRLESRLQVLELELVHARHQQRERGNELVLVQSKAHEDLEARLVQRQSLANDALGAQFLAALEALQDERHQKLELLGSGVESARARMEDGVQALGAQSYAFQAIERRALDSAALLERVERSLSELARAERDRQTDQCWWGVIFVGTTLDKKTVVATKTGFSKSGTLETGELIIDGTTLSGSTLFVWGPCRLVLVRAGELVLLSSPAPCAIVRERLDVGTALFYRVEVF